MINKEMLKLLQSQLKALGTTLPELIFACCNFAPKKLFIDMILGLAGTTNMTVLWGRVGSFLRFYFPSVLHLRYLNDADWWRAMKFRISINISLDAIF